MRRLLALFSGILVAGAAAGPVASPVRQAAPASPAAPFCIVFVVDGLRPDSINPRDTPTIARLRDEGVEYLNGHAVFPTVTRVNASSLVTGAYPDVHGLVSNDMYVRALNPAGPISTGDYRVVLDLRKASDGHVLFADTLGEILHARGKRLVTLSSASNGGGLLLNPGSPEGTGIAIHGSFDRGRIAAFPAAISETVLQRFGPPPAPPAPESAHVQWTGRVLREYVLPELRPDAVIDWLAAPDGAQHAFGVGSPQALEELRLSDRSIGDTLERIRELGLLGRTNVFVLSDHGFAHNATGVDVAQALVEAGLKRAPDSTDVVLVSNGQSVLLHLADRAPERVAPIVRFLQQQDWVDTIFTRDGLSRHEGTFPLSLVQANNPQRGADILFTLAWTSEPNPHGAEGRHTIHSRARTGPLEGAGSGHGGLNPWLVRNTLITWGPAFKTRTKVKAPAGIVDVAPTLLSLMGLEERAGMDGRILREAFKGGPAEPRSGTSVLTTRAGSYAASVQVSRAARRQYVDWARRIR